MCARPTVARRGMNRARAPRARRSASAPVRLTDGAGCATGRVLSYQPRVRVMQERLSTPAWASLRAARDDTAWLYLDLLKKCLTREVFADSYPAFDATGSAAAGWLSRLLRRVFQPFDLAFVKRVPVARHRDMAGSWPTEAETMVGPTRLEHLAWCVREVLTNRIPGDILEAGVWRGGTAIFMRGCLEAWADAERAVWVVDSFRGLPRPDPDRYPRDRASRLWQHRELAVSLETVRENFARYGLLDDRVRFLPGWFRDTLPDAPIGQLAVLRIDADMYESTADALRCLYPSVSPGGFVIIDDYGVMPACRDAVDDYRRDAGILESLTAIDRSAVYWRRTHPGC